MRPDYFVTQGTTIVPHFAFFLIFFFFLLFGHAICRILVPNQGSNSCPLLWRQNLNQYTTSPYILLSTFLIQQYSQLKGRYRKQGTKGQLLFNF